jgi:hypothetical protein
MDLQVGGVSQLNVSKAGFARGTGGFEIYTTSGIERATIGQFLTYFKGSTDYRIVVNDSGGTAGIGLSSGSSTADVLLRRDAANTLAQRNGVNAQAFNLYNTYTDASNYERGFMRFVSNVLQIGAEKLGTGTARALAFQTDGVTRMTIATNGTATFSASINVSGEINAGSSNVIGWGAGRAKLFAPNSSAIRLLPDSGNAALNFGGDTSSFPALKRDTTSLQARLADDSAFTNIQGKLTTETAYTAGTIVATGYLTLYDSTGTAYRVPCVV